jgi:hypothetical protein
MGTRNERLVVGRWRRAIPREISLGTWPIAPAVPAIVHFPTARLWVVKYTEHECLPIHVSRDVDSTVGTVAD